MHPFSYPGPKYNILFRKVFCTLKYLQNKLISKPVNHNIVPFFKIRPLRGNEKMVNPDSYRELKSPNRADTKPLFRGAGAPAAIDEVLVPGLAAYGLRGSPIVGTKTANNASF